MYIRYLCWTSSLRVRWYEWCIIEQTRKECLLVNTPTDAGELVLISRLLLSAFLFGSRRHVPNGTAASHERGSIASGVS